jgi:2-iminobutanoate/2-iminopropanoate deaminase
MKMFFCKNRLLGKDIFVLSKKIKMEKQIINSKSAPAPIGPYNQAVKTGNLLFISGQIALDAITGELVNESISAETTQVMQNLKAILNEAGKSFSAVVKTTIFLSSMEHFTTVNEVYASYFEGDFPARETVAVAGLPKNVNVEISMIAAL